MPTVKDIEEQVIAEIQDALKVTKKDTLGWSTEPEYSANNNLLLRNTAVRIMEVLEQNAELRTGDNALSHIGRKLSTMNDTLDYCDIFNVLTKTLKEDKIPLERTMPNRFKVMKFDK